MSLSAISNEENYYSEDISNEFGKANKFFCIACKGEMVFHRNIAGIKVQHFVHKVECPFETEPESAEHIEMKKWCYENIPATKKYKPDSIMTGNQKPDVLLEVNGKQVAIECQCSKLGYEKWEQRTRSYSEKGIYVLWIFGWKFCPPLYVKTCEKRVGSVEKAAHKLYFGRIYMKLGRNFITPIHFEGVYRESEHSDYNGHWLKSTKHLNFGNQIKNNSLLLTENNSILIARFYDKKWWGL